VRTVSDRYRRQVFNESPPAIVTEVVLFKQFYSSITDSSSDSILSHPTQVTGFFSVGDTVIVTSRVIDAEFTVEQVDANTITLTGFTVNSGDYGAYVCKKINLTEHLDSGGLGTIDQRIETQTLNVFGAGSFRLVFDNSRQDIMNEAAGTGYLFMKTHVGVATSDPSALVLTDSNASLPDLTGTYLEMMSGNAAGQSYSIASSTSTTITIVGDDMVADGVLNGDQYQVSLETVVWVTVKLGWKGMVETNERPIITGGIIDNRSISYNHKQKKVALTCYGYLKRLDYQAAYEVSNPFGEFPYLKGITLVAYDPPSIGAVNYGPRRLQYSFPDGEALAGVSIVEQDELDVRRGPKPFMFRSGDQFSWDYGPWETVNDLDDINDQGNRTFTSYEWDNGEGESDATFNFGSKNRFARFPGTVWAEDVVWVTIDRETGVRSYKKGKPTLTFDGGVKRQASPHLQAVVRKDLDEAFHDNTIEAMTPRGTGFRILGVGDNLYVGSIDRFAGIFFVFETALAAGIEFTVHYSKGYENWVELTVNDGTNGFSEDGWIQWTIPADWRKASIWDDENDTTWNGLYWIKLEAPGAIPFEYNTQFGEVGLDPGDFRDPRGCCADDDYIYTCDYLRHKVIIYTNADTPVYHNEFGVNGSSPGELDNPTDIACDDTYLYVSEYGNGRVTVFLKASPYTYVKTIGSAFGFARCYCVDVDPGAYDEDEHVYIGGWKLEVAYEDYIAIYTKKNTVVDHWQPFSDKNYALTMGVQRCTDPDYIYLVNRGYTDETNEVVRKQKISNHSTIWDWGQGCGAYDADPENGLWHHPHRVVCKRDVLIVSAGWGSVAGETSHVVALLDDHAVDPEDATATYLSHIGSHYADDDYKFKDPHVGAWHKTKLFVCDNLNNKVKVYGWDGANCYQMRRLVGLIGKDNDQLTVDINVFELSSESISEDVIIRHDDSGDPEPATWYQLITAQELSGLLLDQAGYPSGIRSIDDMEITVDQPMLFWYGHAPYLNAHKPITAMSYDSDTSTLYLGMGLEIWKVTETGRFQRVAIVPNRGDGYYLNYEIKLLHEADNVLYGLAVRPYDGSHYKQYGCPAIGFKYNLATDEFTGYDPDFGYGDLDDVANYERGLVLGTHVFRDGRERTYIAILKFQSAGNCDSKLVDPYNITIEQATGENFAIPYDQLVISRYFFSASIDHLSALHMAKGLFTRDRYPSLFFFVRRYYPTHPDIPRGRPYYYASMGHFCQVGHDAKLGLMHYEYPFILRWSYGQEGLLFWDNITHRMVLTKTIATTGVGLGVYRYRPSDDWDSNNLALSHVWSHSDGGRHEIPMCGCHYGFQNYIVTQFCHDNGEGVGALGICRIYENSCKPELYATFYFHSEGFVSSAIGGIVYQGQGRAYFYNSVSGWSDVSSDLHNYTMSATVELDSSADRLYLGFESPFNALRVRTFGSYEGTLVVEYQTSVGFTNIGSGWWVDETDNLAQDGNFSFRLPVEFADLAVSWTVWNKKSWHDVLGAPAGHTAMGDTNELFWVCIRVNPISGSAKLDQIWGTSKVIWHSIDYDDPVNYDQYGLTPLEMAIQPTGGFGNGPVLHGCMWNRDEGLETEVGNALEYFWFTLDVRDGTFTKTQVLAGSVDVSQNQFKGFVHDPDSDKMYAMLTQPTYRDRGGALIRGEYDKTGPTITLVRVAQIPAPEWGVSGRLLAPGDGRIYGVTYPGGFLWHFDTTMYPRVTLADFGSSMSTRQALTHLCQVANCTLRISPDKQAMLERRDHSVAAVDIQDIERLVDVRSLDPWPHRYDGVVVRWENDRGEGGEEGYGQLGWEKNILQIENPFIQDRFLARALAMIQALFFGRSRRVLKAKLPAMLWLELKDIIKVHVATKFLDISGGQGWAIHRWAFNKKRNEIDIEAIEWFGEET